MKKIIIIFLCCLPLLSCQKTHKDIETPGWEDNAVTDTITVMSYNIKYGSPLGSNIPNLEAIANAIKKSKADIVFLQEIDKNTTRSKSKDQLAILSKETDLPYYYYAGAIEYQGGQSGNGILSRYSLSDAKTFNLPRIELENQYVSYRNLITAQITVNDTKITIANTHLALTQENRDLGVPEIIKILSSMNHPTILGGDFNAIPTNSTIRTLNESGFSKTCKTNCNSIPTINPNRELDYIMYRPDARFKVLSHKVINDFSSDHLPIVSTIKIKL